MSSKEIVKRSKSAWEGLKIASMHVDTNLVRCQKRLFPDGKRKKLLYIGFGEGQNLVYMAKEGFEVYGTEIAKSRLKEANKKFKSEKLNADLRLVDSNILPFEDNFFDIVVAWQSLCYNDKQTLNVALDEINRVLKPSGKFLSSMLSSKQKLLCHKEVSPSVYSPAKETGQQNCLVFCFKNKQQIRRVYRKFNDIQIGFYHSELFRSPNFHYVVYGTKPRTTKI